MPPEGAPAGHPLAPPPRRPFLSFRHLSCLATAILLSFYGMISPGDLAFVVFSLVYVPFLSRAAFPPAFPAPEPRVFANSRALGLYVLVAAAVGLLAPAAYILGGVLRGDRAAVEAAAPHLFLLSCQVFMEGVTFAGGFSLPVLAFVPVFYNSKRLFAIADWLRAEVAKVGEEHGAGWRLRLGTGLAIANLAFWCFNLFGFLLPVYLPRAFKRYYGQKVKA